MNSQKKKGAVISYLNIALSMGANLLLTPMLISAWSDDIYSIYKIMLAFAGPLMMLNLGLSTIVTRSIAKYRASDDGNVAEKENTLAVALLTGVVMTLVIIALGVLMRTQISNLYGKNYTEHQLGIAETVFLIFVISTAFHVLSDVFKGCSAGNERFAFLYGLQTVQYVLRFGLTFIFLKMQFGIVAVAAIDLVVGLVCLAASAVYAFVFLKERPRIHYFSPKEALLLFSFSVAILLQALINQVNNNVDIMILGAMVSDTSIITMYSSALSIYAMYNSVLSIFTGLYSRRQRNWL